MENVITYNAQPSAPTPSLFHDLQQAQEAAINNLIHRRINQSSEKQNGHRARTCQHLKPGPSDSRTLNKLTLPPMASQVEK